MNLKTNGKKPLFEILILEGKRCQNINRIGHIMPKTRYKPDSFFHDNDEPNKNTFVIAIRKPRTIGIFCYHCAITVIGMTIKEWKKAGATEEEINNWLPMELRQSHRKVLQE